MVLDGFHRFPETSQLLKRGDRHILIEQLQGHCSFSGDKFNINRLLIVHSNRL